MKSCTTKIIDYLTMEIVLVLSLLLITRQFLTWLNFFLLCFPSDLTVPLGRRKLVPGVNKPRLKSMVDIALTDRSVFFKS